MPHGRRRRGALMELGALTGQWRARARHRLRHRPSQGRARHGVRRVQGAALQRRGFHSGRGFFGRGRGGVAARGEGRRRRPYRRRASRGGRSPGSRRNSSQPFPEVVVAVTGTNGKTSTVELTRQLWRMAGHPSASIGTLGVTTSDEQVTTGLTTPDIVTFLSNMAGPRADGDHPCRVRGVEPRPVAISDRRPAGRGGGLHQSVSRDHLDYHDDDGRLFRGQDAAVRGRARAGRQGGGLDRRFASRTK